jgi:hypothetical protein
MPLQWKRGLQRLYFLAAVIWILSAGGLTYWQIHSEKNSACDQVKLAETVKRNAALRQPPQNGDSVATPPGTPTPKSSLDVLNEVAGKPSLADRFNEVAEAEKEGISENVIEFLEYNRRICNSKTPVKSALEVAFIPALLGYALFLAGCWVASGFKSAH